MRTMAAIVDTCWGPPCRGSIRIARPTIPRMMPAMTPREGRRPRIHSKTAIQSGVVSSNAVKPVGTCCSAQITLPVPQDRRRIPATAVVRISRGRGHAAPRASAIPLRIRPAMRNRAAPMRNTGIDWIE